METKASNNPTRNRKTSILRPLLITFFLDVFCIGLLVPVQPKLITELLAMINVSGNNGNGDISSEVNNPSVISYSSKVYGWMLSAANLIALFSQVGTGYLSDSFKTRKKILLIQTIFISAVLFIGVLVTSNYRSGDSALIWLCVWMFARIIVYSIFGQRITVTYACVSDVTPPEKRSQYFGMIGAGSGVSFIIGPILGGILSKNGPLIPFQIAFIITFINIFLVALLVRETFVPVSQSTNIQKEQTFITTLKSMLKLDYLLIAFALSNLASAGVKSIWVHYTSYRFQYTTFDSGILLGMNGLGYAIVQGFVLGRMIKKFGESNLLMFSLAMDIVSNAIYAFGNKSYYLWICIPFSSLAGMSEPLFKALVSKQRAEGEQATLQGALSSLQSITRIISPLVIGYAFGFFTSDDSPVHLPGAPFLIATLFSVFAFFVLRLNQR